MSTLSVSQVTEIDVIVTINGKRHYVIPKEGTERDELMNKLNALRLLLDSHYINSVSAEDLIAFVEKSLNKQDKRLKAKDKKQNG